MFQKLLRNTKVKKTICALIGITVILSFSENTANIKKVAEDFLPRQLSLYLGGGSCLWQPPTYEVPTNVSFTKTLVAGYPSGDKRMAYAQMEALTGLSARDEWDFAFMGSTNQPFIKANYPHHQGLWGWGEEADQVVLVIRNIRRSMIEYHDILWDIGYAENFQEAHARANNLYTGRPPKAAFVAWRDLRVLDEIHWYGWLIDFYMEGGLMRDVFNHKITTPEHWYMLLQPQRYTKEESAYNLIVGNTTFVPKAFDPHCVNDVTSGCEPIQILSAERLSDPVKGPEEGRKIANLLKHQSGVKNFLIEEDAWECIWNELIRNKKGLKLFADRAGSKERNVEYNFSEEMLSEMTKELNRLIIKYSGSAWNFKPTAITLVELLSEHLDLIKTELNEVKSGQRRLTEEDFLGPKTRQMVFPISFDHPE